MRHAAVLTWLALAGAACSDSSHQDACSGAACAGDAGAGAIAGAAGHHAGGAFAAIGGGGGRAGADGRTGSAAGGGGGHAAAVEHAGADADGGGEPAAGAGSGGAGAAAGAAALVFSPYKDTSISLDWNSNVISTAVSGTMTALSADVSGSELKTLTLAFATGECGSESWGGVGGAQLATANQAALDRAGIRYILSTGGAAGTFTCASDAGMEAFIARWAGPGLIGVDFDIEGGQTQPIIDDLIARIAAAHAAHPQLRFSLTLATLAASVAGQDSARSRGANAEDNFNSYGTNTLIAVKTKLGFTGEADTWPDYLTVNLMTMDYGSPAPGNCVVSDGNCQMGQSALQAAYNLHDHWGVPFSAIELTPMIGGNDATGETFTLDDADTIARFAREMSLAGLHDWSYDRDRDCMPGSASPTCNTYGSAGTKGFLKRFLSALSK
jgi:hypothetical protein